MLVDGDGIVSLRVSERSENVCDQNKNVFMQIVVVVILGYHFNLNLVST